MNSLEPVKGSNSFATNMKLERCLIDYFESNLVMQNAFSRSRASLLTQGKLCSVISVPQHLMMSLLGP